MMFENYELLSGLGRVLIVLLFFGGGFSVAAGIVCLFCVIMAEIQRIKDKEPIDLKTTKGFVLVTIGLLVGGGLMIKGHVSLSHYMAGIQNSKIEVSPDYYAGITASKELTLYKKEMIKKEGTKIETLSGIDVVKSVKVQSEEFKKVSIVRCKTLGLEECVAKIKENLSAVAQMNSSIQVVEL
jgi:hypothetical protein